MLRTYWMYSMAIIVSEGVGWGMLWVHHIYIVLTAYSSLFPQCNFASKPYYNLKKVWLHWHWHNSKKVEKGKQSYSLLGQGYSRSKALQGWYAHCHFLQLTVDLHNQISIPCSADNDSSSILPLRAVSKCWKDVAEFAAFHAFELEEFNLNLSDNSLVLRWAAYSLLLDGIIGSVGFNNVQTPIVLVLCFSLVGNNHFRKLF